ncbi:MAG TPA: glycoside hydrolase family 9 protein [Pseudobacteroides sp.]|uniref:glycoside hydrolase family 9 protein n=1 Tax=Pseudobacteroides sp. TaxID=1968840 RepID=UPI002F93726D
MKKTISLLVMFSIFVGMLVPQASYSAASNFNYGEALQKSLIFYEFQRSGKLPDDKRDNWRGDSTTTDGADAGLDLTGGWFDAGDHVKFNLPMAYTLAMLAWSVYEDKDAYVKSGQYKYVMDSIKWAADYFIKCHPSPNVYYFQVGDGISDHNWWGAPEVMTLKRPSYKATTSSGASTVSAETAAALAATSIVFKDVDPTYAANCLKHAKELFAFAESTKSDAAYSPVADNFYKSHSSFWDEFSWAGTWIYLAGGDSSFLDKAESYVGNWGTEMGTTTIKYKWAHCWDDVHIGASLLLARITKKDIYKKVMENHLDWLTTGANGERAKYSPKGMVFIDGWGSLRYATTCAFIADLYADSAECPTSKTATYRSFAKTQVDYALGSTGRSYVVGYGTNPPQHPHHRAAHGSWGDNFNIPDKHRHILYGALVGGPGVSDDYDDSTNNYTNNEVACDYNAGFAAVLARMYDKFGGEPISGFNAIEKPGLEVYISGSATSSDSKTDFKVMLYNKSAWPARSYNNLSFKYFMDLSEVYAAGRTYKDVTVTINYAEGGKSGGIFPYDESKHIYYALIDFNGVTVVPGGAISFRKEAQVVLAGPSGVKWDGTNDYSYKGFAAGTEDNPNMPVYASGKLLYGIEPDGTRPSTQIPSTTPTPSTPTPVSPTPFVTGLPRDYSSVSGYVSPESAVSSTSSELKAGFTVTVEGTSFKAVTDDKGYFYIPNIKLPSSSNYIFSLLISKSGFLTRKIDNLQGSFVYFVGTSSAPAVMWAGDIPVNGVSDNAINIKDVVEISKVFNSISTDAKYNPDCDLNKDGSINMSDVIVVAKYFGKVSSDYSPVSISKITA